MVNYQNSKIYIIKSPNTDKVYIGSTSATLPQRMRNHRWDFNHRRQKKDLAVFKIFEEGDTYIELIELFPCSCMDELRKREREVMEQYDNCVNKRMAYVSREERKQYEKEFYQKNKDDINRRSLERYYKKKDALVKC